MLNPHRKPREAEVHTPQRPLARNLRTYVVRALGDMFYGIIEPTWLKVIKKAYDHVTVGTTRLTAADIRQVRSQICPGDVLIARNEAAATTRAIEILGSAWTHVGICIDKHSVIEALDIAGVVETSTTEFLLRYTRVALLRPTDAAWDRQKATSWARQQVGKPYNFDLTLADDAFYCSALVYMAWKHAGITLQEPNTDAFTEPVITPDDLYLNNRQILSALWECNRETIDERGDGLRLVLDYTIEAALESLNELNQAICKQEEEPPPIDQDSDSKAA